MTPKGRVSLAAILAGTVTLVCGAILALADARNSPVSDETGHLVAGVSIWQFGCFDSYPVNPPLTRAIAALPVVCSRPAIEGLFDRDDWRNPASRPQWSLGIRFVRDNPDRVMLYFAWARWALLPFSLLGGFICWRWASELYGSAAGLLACTLWCFSPNVLAWAATICPDAAAASLGITAAYFFWRWLKNPDWLESFVAGVMLGLAQLTKMTWTILFALWPMIWLVWLVRRPSAMRSPVVGRVTQCVQLCILLLTALWVLNIGYAFEGSFTRLSDFTFVSRTLAASGSTVDGAEGGNRFAQTWLGQVPVPLPANYVRGMDLQKAEFERGLPSYLFGQWSDRGWWYYYIVCAVLKVPLGTWLLLLLAIAYRIIAALRRHTRADANKGHVSGLDRSFPSSAAADPTIAAQAPTAPALDLCTWKLDSCILLLPALAVFVLASSQTGISRHFRYMLPAFPFVFVWISQIACVAWQKPRTIGVLVGGAVLWMVVSSLSVYPHSMSYFNELAGGPRGGHRYLLDANIDWGQDVLYLKDWCQEHPEARPLHVLFRNSYSQDLFGIENERNPPVGPSMANRNRNELTLPTRSVTAFAGTTEQMPWQAGPRPGWYACSIHRIHDPGGAYLYFLHFKPIAMAGYSIYIYHISLDEANGVRRELGLPELPLPEPPDRARWLTRSSDQPGPRNDSDRLSLRVAIFHAGQLSADATKNFRAILDSETGWTWKALDAEDIRAGGLAPFDLVIFPGGSGSQQAAALKGEGAQSVREFVLAGGGYVGICGGAFLATAEYPWSLALINAKTLTGQRYVPGVGSRSMAARGAGTVQVELTDTGQKFFSNSPRLMNIRYSGGPILSPAGREDLPPCVPLAVYRSELWQYEPQRGTMIGTPAIIAGKFGKGRVIAFSPHPETTQGLETLVKSAVLWAARRSALPQHQYKTTR